MVVTDLEHAEQQLPALPALQKAIAFLRRPEAESLPEGRIDLEGDSLYVLVQRYRTVAEGDWRFEGHRRTIDVQYVASGAEVIGWVPTDQATISPGYDEKETWLGTVDPALVVPVALRAGQLAVLFPSDAHAPKVALASGPTDVTKIVVKVLIEQQDG